MSGAVKVNIWLSEAGNYFISKEKADADTIEAIFKRERKRQSLETIERRDYRVVRVRYHGDI